MSANVIAMLLRQSNRHVCKLKNLNKFTRVSAFIHHKCCNNYAVINSTQGLLLNKSVLQHDAWSSAAVPCRGIKKDSVVEGRATARDVESSESESSDSDKKGASTKKERGTSEFWRLKMRTLHALLDINKDGVVSYDDFKLMGDRFIKLGHLTGPQQIEFRDTLKSVWEEQWGSTDAYNMVNSYQYLENMHHVVNDKSLKKKAHRFLPYLFRAVDKDKSGEISVEEFKLFFTCLGLEEEEAVASFRAIDINHDNRLSQKEFVKYGREFFLSEDERKPSRGFWGPLLKDH